ncbi:MAG: Uma2 family endonuclease, partial [Acidobacteria bacterium]
MPAHAQPWTFTADDYEKMTAAGILKEDHRVELIEG